MIPPKTPDFKRFSVSLLLGWALLAGISTGFAQVQKGRCGLSKQFAILSAKSADMAYEYIRDAHFTTNPVWADHYLDTARYYTEQSIDAMDSAIYAAGDSDIIALGHARISKNYNMETRRSVFAAKASDWNRKREIAEEGTFISANAVVEAYHASFYFSGCKEKETPKEPEKKDSVPQTPVVQKPITKLDVDQTLFALLTEHINEKSAETKSELARLNSQISVEKDPAKLAKLQEQARKLMEKEKEYVTKNKSVSDKLNQINTQIEARDKNNTSANNESTVFAKTMNRPPDQWNKQIVMDSELPEGLIYQVQVGVYKNAISPQLFKGLTPLYGKTVPGGVSYSTGMFDHLADATQAKTYVKSMGLADAFVVAYYNKKKISIAEAQKLEKK